MNSCNVALQWSFLCQLSKPTVVVEGVSCVMGNLGKPLNFPLVWTRKGAVEPRRSNWYCAARDYLRIGPSGAGCLGAHCMEWRSYGVRGSDGQYFLCEEAPYLSIATWRASWVSNVSDYCGEHTRWDTRTRELGEPCRPKAATLAFVGGGRMHAELTGVSACQCEWLVR